MKNKIFLMFFIYYLYKNNLLKCFYLLYYFFEKEKIFNINKFKTLNIILVNNYSFYI